MRAAAMSRMRGFAPGLFLTIVLGSIVFWIGYDNGSYGSASRGTVAIALWWALVLAVVFRLSRIRRLPKASLLAGGLIGALAVWTLASVAWAPSAEEAFTEFNRVMLYLGVYVLVLLAARRQDVERWCNGIAIAIVGIGVVALLSRLVPGLFSDRGVAAFLPGSATRLSFPLGYWNGLAIFVALGVPLLLRTAVTARTPTRRGLALAPVPVLAAVIYLASSRGGVATATVAMLIFLVLTERRWSAVAAMIVALGGSAAAIAVLLQRDELVDGPLGTDVVESQGRSAAVLILLACAGTALAFGVGARLLGGRFRPPVWVGRLTAAVAAVGIVGAIVASDPAKRFEVFKRAPGEGISYAPGDFVRSHLLSGSGSGRWQFWSVAVDAWKEERVLGIGAGSYEHWWAEHTPISYFVRDAHSLYLEILGELGLVGFGLVVALVVTGVLVGARSALRLTGDARVATAALTSLFAGYALALGIDWMWELTVVSVVGIAALALITGGATEVPRALRPAHVGEAAPRFPKWAFGVGALALALAWAAISAQGLQLLADRALTRSQQHVREGDADRALEDALAARRTLPWAADPFLQLALVDEVRGELSQARVRIHQAIDRSPKDWSLWLVAARIETKLGRVAAAERSLRRATSLNPRSPLFAGLQEREPAG